MSLYIGNERVAPTMLPSSSGISIPLEVSANGELQKPTSSFTWSLPNNVTSITSSAILNYAFYDCTGLTSVDLSSLTTVSGTSAMSYAFNGCTNLTSVDLSSLTTVSGSGAMVRAFNGCTGLTSVDLSSLTTVSGSGVNGTMAYSFSSCTSLTNINFNSLTNIYDHCFHFAFRDSASLATLSFPSLNSTSFGSYTNQFSNMLAGVTGCTVHFPSNLQSVIGSWSDVTAGFGGTNTTVLFDLPATT